MTLGIGTRVGPFELTGTLGAGGMGEVYRARDTQLGRDVALKILPDHLIDPERLARFTREAQVVASLSHPNIAAIHGLEQLEGRPVLVLELVEGPTLAERIAQAPIPQDEAVAIARQIAEALEAAHDQGVVHRDLKPANVKLRPDGLVKVLDFGLAKLTEGPAKAGPYGSGATPFEPTLSPTITSPAMTGMGLILGTAAYMSPEQAAGKPADKRADIWSFGVVLWEMLTGQRLFGDGESISHVLADVLRAPIDFDKIPAGALRELARRCLDRHVKTRLRDIGEARVILSRPIEPPVVVRDVVAPQRSTVVPWAVAALLAIAAGVALWAPWRTEPDRVPTRVDVDLGADVALPPSGRSVVISPDSTRLAYIALKDRRPRLYLRQVDALDDEPAMELPGTEGATSVDFSPDSRSLVFTAGRSVSRISVDGGDPLRLADTDTENNLVTWGDGDMIIVSGRGSGLRQIPRDKGAPVKLTELVGDESIHAQAHVLPGAKTVLFAAGTPQRATTAIEAVSLADQRRKVIVSSGTAPYYLPSGHLLFLRQGKLFAIRFDLARVETVGDAVPLVTDVSTFAAGLVQAGAFSVSTNGTLVFRKGSNDPAVAAPVESSTIQIIEGAGTRRLLVPTAGPYRTPRFSPDSRQLSLTVSGALDTLSILTLETGVMRSLGFTGRDAIWRPPDGQHLVFQKIGTFGLNSVRTIGGQPLSLLPNVTVQPGSSFSPDGKRLAYSRTGEASRREIFIVDVMEEGGQLKAGTPQRFSPRALDERAPQYSPDGGWVAFVRNQSGTDEVWVRATSPGQRGPHETQISNGGRGARWSYPTQELLYQAGDQIMAVKYTIKGEEFVPQRPTVRVEKLGAVGASWDIARDGRIVVITPAASSDLSSTPAPPEHTVVFVRNFFDEVRRRVK